MTAPSERAGEKVEDGGPAFPNSFSWRTGMTLRDYFAAATLTGLVGRDSRVSQFGFKEEIVVLVDELAKRAYQQADAMLAERSRMLKERSK